MNFLKVIVFKSNLWEYSIEKFSEVLNVQHRYSIFLLIDEFYLVNLSSLNSSMNKDLFKFIE